MELLQPHGRCVWGKGDVLAQHRTTQTTDLVLGAVGLGGAEEELVLGERKEPLESVTTIGP